MVSVFVAVISRKSFLPTLLRLMWFKLPLFSQRRALRLAHLIDRR